MAPEVFISYHTGSSAQTVQQICAALEGAGISCWYAPRNVEGDYASSIVRAINQCRVFLLILNKNSNLSEDVRNEINCAFERFRRHEDITLLPFRVDDCALSDAVMYYLGRIHIMDGSLPPEIQRVRELRDRISGILCRKPEKTALVDHGAPVKTQCAIVGSMVYADNHFIGRANELDAIHTTLSCRDNKLFLVGMGGIGKSEIAKAYCARFPEAYDVILWISFDGSLEKTLINDFSFPIRGLERSDHPNDSDRAYFQRKLKTLKTVADSRVLIVVDNFDTSQDPDLRDFCSGSYSVLFTTRCRGISPDLPELEISPMTDETELLELFRAEYKRTVSDTAPVTALLRALNGHPLSIRLVASAMQSRRISPESMLQLLNDGAAQMKARNARAAELIFGRLQQVFSLAALSEEERHLLKNLALLPLGGVPVETLFDWCGLDDFDVIDELIRKSWVIHNPATDEVHLHPLVSQLMLEELRADLSCCDALLTALIGIQKAVFHQSFETRSLVLACLSSICSKLPPEHPKTWDILWSQARMEFETSLYLPAVSKLQALLARTEDLEKRLMLFNKISQGCYLSGLGEEAIRQAEAGLALLAHIPEEQLSRTLGSQAKSLHIRIAESYRLMEDYDLAEKHARIGAADRDRFYTRTPQDAQAWAAMHLAKILFRRNKPGDLEECKALYRQAFALFGQIGDRFSTAYGLHTMGQISMMEGRYEDGLRETEDARGILLGALGPQHIDIAINHTLKANIYRAMGNETEALAHYGKAKEIMLQTNHTTHLRVLEQIVQSGKIGYVR